MELRREFETLAFSSDSSIFYIDLESVYGKLVILGQFTNDEVLTTHFIGSLPNDLYCQVIAILFATGNLLCQEAYDIVVNY